MTVTSWQEAREFIDNLRIENGGLTKDDVEFLKRTRPHILRTLDNVRRKLGASTKTLATNLYTKDTRFVYELTQNAEDNRYSTAEAASESPRLSFSVYQDRIVIDSNEDGFSEANIKAICSIGESTKAFSDGYIGEKGIGFKSVFKVARKVHVQSGLFSFAFEYQHDEEADGLGMVTPINETHVNVPRAVRTRITLFLLQNCDRAKLYREFTDLPDTLLLFLKKLKIFGVKISIPGHREVDSVYSLSSSENGVRIHKTRANLFPTVQNYWITRQRVKNMPNDRARKNINEAEVILAFPLDPDETPVLADQLVFAFLPLRKAGYKFLIQSDFITQASREDVFDSPWNNRLLDEVTNTFLQSVDSFLKHPKLKYSWVRYVPASPIADDFWGRLQEKIANALASRKLFYSMSSELLTANHLDIVTKQYRGEDGQPLLPDGYKGPTAYISESYDEHLDLPILKSLGAEDISLKGFLNRLEQDLERPDPRLYSMPLEALWHTQVASHLILGLNANSDLIKRLKIIPLSNGRYVCPLNASIFYQKSGGIEIPEGLELNLVEEGAIGNDTRKELFDKVGVTECIPPRVFPLIEQRYRSFGITMQQSIEDIKFMFWHHVELPPEALRIRLAPKDGNSYFNPNAESNGWTYCPRSEHPYSVSKIFGPVIPPDLVHNVKIIRPRYYDELEVCGHRNDISGIEWIRDYFQIKGPPQLRNRLSERELSFEVDYIITHKPQFLLGVLEASWNQFQSTASWIEKLESAKVPIMNSAKLTQLCVSYLPLPRLQNIVSRLELGKDFAFIEELKDITDSTEGRWRFLEKFGVGIRENASFWITLLLYALSKNDIEQDVICEIYSNLQRYTEDEDIAKIKDVFAAFQCIYLPSSNLEDSGSWKYLHECVWDGPEWFNFKVRLAGIERYRRLSSLFVNTLDITDVDHSDLLSNIRHIKTNPTLLTSTERERKVMLLYEQLDGKCSDDAVADSTRSAFNNEELVYNPKNQSWYSPSSCIWAEDQIQLPGKISMATTYKRLRSFFIDKLSVSKPNLRMHIRSLQQKALENPNKGDIMQEMLNICAFNPMPKSLEELSTCKCLPVKLPSGPISWQDSSGEFAIIDRRAYGRMFSGKVNFLDFTLEEVHSLKSLLVGLGLQDRYTSRTVQETTTVRGGLASERLSQDLRRKAYAMCRYAAHHGSTAMKEEPLATFSALQNLEVFTSDYISKSVSINQHGRRVVVDQEMAYFHLEAQDDKLNLYVPQRRNHQQVCLLRQLPITLLKHLGVQDLSSYGELGSIVTAPNLFVVDELLHQGGIIEVERIVRLDEDDEDNSEEGSRLAESQPNFASMIQSPSPQGFTSARLRGPSPNVPVPSRVETSEERLFTPRTPLSVRSPSPPAPEQVNLYRELLDSVIRQARSISDLPRVGHAVVGPVSDVVLDTSLAVSSTIVNEKEFRIGAAGELFVFELLNVLLPDFDRGNWRSTIRDRVAVHESYRNFTRWLWTETSDIVYEDKDSHLTKMLIERGYLTGSTWRDRSPTYYIEVKATPGPLRTQFYCSQNQYDLMESMTLREGTHADRIYIIARVYALGNSGMGLKLYLDPATLKREGQLDFRVEKYIITPVS